jgi:hypothetical protein
MLSLVQQKQQTPQCFTTHNGISADRRKNQGGEKAETKDIDT